MTPDLSLERYRRLVPLAPRVVERGTVVQSDGLIIESRGPRASIRDICWISRGPLPPVQAEVVGFREQAIRLMALGDTRGIQPGAEVVSTGRPLQIRVADTLLGRIVDGLGTPLDGDAVEGGRLVDVDAAPPPALERSPIRQALSLGVRAFDMLLTCGRGQRVGIHAGSGVGKSTLLGMLARHSRADVNVIALVGERGREVQEFIHKNLGEQGLLRSVVVVATSDQPALVRARAAFVATAIAEYFRDQGLDVCLIADSITRLAMALREIGLAAGEPPTTRGYTPSVFATLPRLLERAGTSAVGSITGLYTVLVEADDQNEIVADTVRSILDGHVVLSRELASEGHFPAIDVLESISRLMPDVTSEAHQRAAQVIREHLAIYRKERDLITIGAYRSGSNARTDHVIAQREAVLAFLRQGVNESAPFEESLAALVRLAGAGMPSGTGAGSAGLGPHAGAPGSEVRGPHGAPGSDARGPQTVTPGSAGSMPRAAASPSAAPARRAAAPASTGPVAPVSALAPAQHAPGRVGR